MIPTPSNPAITRLRVWNSLFAEPVVRDVVYPLLDRSMPADVRSAGPWTAAKWAIEFASSDAFPTAVSPMHQASHPHAMTVSARRRYSMLTVPVASAMGAEGWAGSGGEPLQSAASIRVATEGASGLVAAMREWMQKSSSPLLLPTAAESEAMIPLLCLWQVAGPAVSDWTLRKHSTPEVQHAVRDVVRFTIARMPERGGRLWTKVDPIIMHEVGDKMHFGSWVGHGQFRLDPLHNPRTLGSAWSEQFVNEPLFVGFGRMAADIGRLAALIEPTLSKGEYAIESDEIGAFTNLGDRRSLYSAVRYFSPSVSFAPVSGEASQAAVLRAGQDPHSAVRVRALRAAYDGWCQKMAEKGMSVNESHLKRVATVARHFESSSWRELSEDRQAPDIPHDARLMLTDAHPWAEIGRARILAQIIPMIEVRLQTLNVVLEIPNGASLSHVRAGWQTQPELAKRMGELHALKLLHRLTPREPHEEVASLESDSREYWRRFLTAQPNPYCGLTEPENLIRGLAPMAYARRLQTVLAECWSADNADPLVASALREKLGSLIWRQAATRAGVAKVPLSYEEAVLGAALEVAERRDVPGFGRSTAYALAFGVAMGSGGDPRLPDVTDVAMAHRARALANKLSFGAMLISGSSAVVAQLVIDWQKFSKAHNAAAHRDPRFAALAKSISNLQSFVERRTGKASLGSALKVPQFWESILAPGDGMTAFVHSFVATPERRPGEIAAEQAGVFSGSHPFLVPDFGSALVGVQNASIPIHATNVDHKPPTKVTIDWGKGVLVNAVEAVAPMLDAFALGRGKEWTSPQVPQIALVESAAQRALVAAPGQDANSVYERLLSEARERYPQFRFGISTSTVTQMPHVSAVPRFLEAESRHASSLLKMLTDVDIVPNAGLAQRANESLAQVFRPNRTGVLYNNAQAVVWAAALRSALNDFAAEGPSWLALGQALDGFLGVHRKVMDEIGRNRGAGRERRPGVQHDQQYSLQAEAITQSLRMTGPLPSNLLWHLRGHVLAAIHGNLLKTAREVARAHLGPEAEQNARAAVLSAVVAGTRNTIRGADEFVQNPHLARPALSAPTRALDTSLAPSGNHKATEPMILDGR